MILTNRSNLDIIFKNKIVKKKMEDFSVAKRELGTSMAKKLMQRMGEIKDSLSVGDLGRDVRATDPHFLKGNRKEDLSIVIKDNMRIITRPNMKEEEYIINGSINFFKITKLRINKVEDYHD